MGNAFICRRGGGGSTFRGLTVVSQPNKTSYLPGQYIDMTGAVIGADFGNFVVPIDYTGLYSPTRALTASDTAITVTATYGNITKSVQIPITVTNVSTTFGNNTWEMIAYISSLGEANNFWSIGDSKIENGITYTIIGMSHDFLSSTDAKYRDSSYNRNTKKAGLTIQVMTAAGPAVMNETATNIGGWDECYMRNTVMPAYLAGMSSDIRAVMRTVDKTTSIGGYNTTAMTTSRDQLFLLAASEMKSPVNTVVLLSEIDANPIYAYYANGEAAYKGVAEWSRSPHKPQYCNEECHFVAYTNANLFLETDANTSYSYFPAFCI